MSKRFIDTELFRKQWFRKLTPVQKALWVYLFTQCDLAGVIEKDMDAFSFQLGATVSEEDLRALEEQIEEIQGKKLHVKDFIEFQYGELSEKCPAHKGVLKAIEKYDFTRVFKLDGTVPKPNGKGKVTQTELMEDDSKIPFFEFMSAQQQGSLVLCTTWKEWLAFRKNEKKDEVKERAAKQQLKFLEQQGEIDAQICVITQSIRNGWQGLFELKRSTGKPVHPNAQAAAKKYGNNEISVGGK